MAITPPSRPAINGIPIGVEGYAVKSLLGRRIPLALGFTRHPVGEPVIRLRVHRKILPILSSQLPPPVHGKESPGFIGPAPGPRVAFEGFAALGLTKS